MTRRISLIFLFTISIVLVALCGCRQLTPVDQIGSRENPVGTVNLMATIVIPDYIDTVPSDTLWNESGARFLDPNTVLIRLQIHNVDPKYDHTVPISSFTERDDGSMEAAIEFPAVPTGDSLSIDIDALDSEDKLLCGIWTSRDVSLYNNKPLVFTMAPVSNRTLALGDTATGTVALNRFDHSRFRPASTGLLKISLVSDDDLDLYVHRDGYRYETSDPWYTTPSFFERGTPTRETAIIEVTDSFINDDLYFSVFQNDASAELSEFSINIDWVAPQSFDPRLIHQALPASSYSSIAGQPGTQALWSADIVDFAVHYELPFDFLWCGDLERDLWISACGVASFWPFGMQTFLLPQYENRDELARLPNNYVALFMDAVIPPEDETPDVFIRIEGSIPDRVAVIEWNGVESIAREGCFYSAQLRLFERDGRIEMLYDRDNSVDTPLYPTFYGLRTEIQNNTGTETIGPGDSDAYPADDLAFFLSDNALPVINLNVPERMNPEVYFTYDASESVDIDGLIVDWDWDFGDGGTGSGPTIDHEYTAEGDYSGRITLTDDEGGTRTKTFQVQVVRHPVLQWTADSTDWTIGDNIQSIATDGSTVWAGNWSDGILRSDDQGATWINYSYVEGDADGLPYRYVDTLAYEGGKLYAGTGELGISSDMGETWEHTGVYMGEGLDVAGNFIVGVDYDLTMSRDAGSTWEHIVDIGGRDSSTNPLSIGINGDDLWLGFTNGRDGEIEYDAELYHSADLGSTWTRVNAVSNGSAIIDIDTDGDAVHIATASGYVRSLDRGASWQRFYPSSGIGTSVLYAVDAQDGIIALGGYPSSGNFGGVSFSLDNGESWVTITTEDGLPHNQVNAVDVVGNVIAVGTSGGVAFFQLP